MRCNAKARTRRIASVASWPTKPRVHDIASTCAACVEGGCDAGDEVIHALKGRSAGVSDIYGIARCTISHLRHIV